MLFVFTLLADFAQPPPPARRRASASSGGDAARLLWLIKRRALLKIIRVSRSCHAHFDHFQNLTIVITSGSGGTGLIGVQLAKAFGAGTVVTAASGADNIALVKSFGADVVIDYKVENIFDSMANNSIDLVFDNYGAKGSADRAMPKMKDPSVYLLLPGGEKGTLSKNPRPGVGVSPLPVFLFPWQTLPLFGSSC